MRILLFSSSYAPRTGGLETVTRRLAKDLAGRGHTVLVATNRYPHSLPHWERIDGIPVHRQIYPDLLNGVFFGPRWHRVKEGALLLLAPVVLLRLTVLVLRFRPDIINVHYFSYPALWMLFVGRLLRRPVVLSFHGSDLSSVPYPANYRTSLQIACALADGYTACSENLLGYLKPLLSRVQNTHAMAIHNGIDVQPSGAEIPDVPSPFIFVSSRFVEKKGVRVILEAGAVLRDRGVQVPIVIAGDGPERDRLRKVASDLGIETQVVFLGTVSHEVSRALTAISTLVAIPSYWEAFGMVALEAMAACKAVVASDTGGLPEIVLDGETGLLVAPGDAPGFADAIQSLIADPERREAMGQRGHDRAIQCFTWARMVDGYLDIYSRTRRSRLSRVRGRASAAQG